ncbi:MAG: hypothetical protein QOC67_455, partial [Pseudonocardiales bacterium]|nr:hypothetical protein [Pseudonocardiales bacterium]
YRNVIIADPKRFHWLPVPEEPGVHRKYLGSFSERAVWLEMVRLGPGAQWFSTDEHARRLIVGLSGRAALGQQLVGRLTALQVEPRERLHLTAGAEAELFVVGLPPVATPPMTSEQFDYVEITDAEPDLTATPHRGQ